jgi:ketosteroid isomerase-like protein
MSEESTTPDLGGLLRDLIDAGNVRDFDAQVRFYAPDAVFKIGMEVFEGRLAIRRFFEDWIGGFEEYAMEVEEFLDLGHGVGFSVYLMTGRPHGSANEVRQHFASVGVWVEGLIETSVNYGDIAEGRAAAERLAKSRE